MDHDGDEPVVAERAALGQHRVAEIADHAVDIEVVAADGALMLDTVISEHDLISVFAEDHSISRHSHVAGEISVGDQMRVLAVHRHEPLRHRNRVERLQFLLLAVSRGVDIDHPRVEDPDAVPSEPVAHGGDRSLIARDRVGTEDHRVVVVELEPLALANRHLGERGPRLALRAGAHDQGLLRIEFVEVFDVAQRPVGNPQDADVPGQLDVAAHREPERHQHPIVLDRGIGELLKPMDMTGERRHDDPTTLLPTNQRGQIATDLRLGAGSARRIRIGGVSHQQPDAGIVGEGADTAEVGAAPVDRGEVELEVARVQDHALRGVERRDVARGDRVGHREEFAVERTDIDPVTVVHRPQFGVLVQTPLAKFVVDHAEGERRAVDRQRQVGQQVRQRPDVVLMGVCRNDSVDPVGVLDQVRQIGQDGVDTRQVIAAEHLAAIEDDDASLRLDGCTVPADLAEPAEERDRDRCGHPALSSDRGRQARPWLRSRRTPVRAPSADGSGRPAVP